MLKATGMNDNEIIKQIYPNIDYYIDLDALIIVREGEDNFVAGALLQKAKDLKKVIKLAREDAYCKAVETKQEAYIL